MKWMCAWHILDLSLKQRNKIININIWKYVLLIHIVAFQRKFRVLISFMWIWKLKSKQKEKKIGKIKEKDKNLSWVGFPPFGRLPLHPAPAHLPPLADRWGPASATLTMLSHAHVTAWWGHSVRSSVNLLAPSSPRGLHPANPISWYSRRGCLDMVLTLSINNPWDPPPLPLKSLRRELSRRRVQRRDLPPPGNFIFTGAAVTMLALGTLSCRGRHRCWGCGVRRLLRHSEFLVDAPSTPLSRPSSTSGLHALWFLGKTSPWRSHLYYLCVAFLGVGFRRRSAETAGASHGRHRGGGRAVVGWPDWGRSSVRRRSRNGRSRLDPR
jgi:hypothetical protein